MPLRCADSKHLLLLAALAGCSQPIASIDAGSDSGFDAGADAGLDAGTDAGRDAGTEPVFPGNRQRDISATALQIDLSNLTGIATLSVSRADAGGASFEAAGLTIASVTRDDGGTVTWRLDGGWLDVATGLEPDTFVVHYGFTGNRSGFDGLMIGGSTVTWPTLCGNLFPCHSDPADGVLFTLDIHGNPPGTTVVYAPSVPIEEPAYLVAWATKSYTPFEAGFTDAGTQVTAWWTSSQSGAVAATKHLVQFVDFFERTYGPYAYGPRMGPVEVTWGIPGGIEHHPFWHVDRSLFTDDDTQAHEAAHGWFGDAVRVRCWEDLVISEGAAVYLSARARAFVADGGTASWTLPSPGTVVWPDGCDLIDPYTLLDPSYGSGAQFYGALEARLGAAAFDRALRRFYLERRGTAAGVQELLDAVQAETGYDATTCARTWLKLGQPAPCP